MNDPIKNFVEELAEAKVNKDSKNHYSLDYSISKGFSAQMNLLCYLTTMKKLMKTETLFLGEAPGHKGCTLTGVPFTSEAIIFSGKYKLFNYEDSFEDEAKERGVKFQTEATAKIVWSAFDELDIYPLLWNAYPFSPFNSTTNKPNRKPTTAEIASDGKKYFEKLIKLIPVKNFVAVGKVAESAYKIFGIQDYESIRHPSFGGKCEFIAGLHRLKEKGLFLK